MYPIHLEQQYESLFTSDFDRFSARLLREIRQELFPDGEDSAITKSDGLRADADDSFSILEALKAAMLGSIGSSDDGRIKKVFSLLNAWNKSFISESLEKMMTRLNTPQDTAVTGRIEATKWMTTTQLSGSMIDTILDRTVKVNSALKSSLFSEHANSIFDILSNGLSNGKSFPEMVDDLQRQTGADRNKARFWARDQASKFYGAVNETRQTEAGIPGYVWRCVTDGHTRDNHYMMNGTYHDWKNPPAVGLHGEKKHPGEDWNCRCWAEPAFGNEYEDPTKESEWSKEKVHVEGPKTTEIKKSSDAERYVRDNNLADNVSFKGVTSEGMIHVQEWVQELKTLLADFPTLRSHMCFTGTIQEHNLFAKAKGFHIGKTSSSTIAQAYRPSLIRGISLNKLQVNDKDFISRLKKAETVNFHPVGCSTVKSVLDHEIAHILDYMLSLDSDPQIGYLWKEFQRLSIVERDRQLSRYASVNVHEFIAEAFSEYRNNPGCRTLAKKVGDIITAKYELKGRGL